MTTYCTLIFGGIGIFCLLLIILFRLRHSSSEGDSFPVFGSIQGTNTAGVALLVSSFPILIEAFSNLYIQRMGSINNKIVLGRACYAVATFLFGLQLTLQYDIFQIFSSYEDSVWFMFYSYRIVLVSIFMYFISATDSMESASSAASVVITILTCAVTCFDAADNIELRFGIKNVLTVIYIAFTTLFLTWQSLRAWRHQTTYLHFLYVNLMLGYFVLDCPGFSVCHVTTIIVNGTSPMIASIYVCVLVATVLTVITCLIANHDVITYRDQLIATKKAYQRYYSHELRNPMTVAEVGVEYCMKKIPEHTTDIKMKEMRDTLAEVKVACEDSLIILDDFLLYDKIESSQLVVQKETINVINFISDYLAMYKIQLRSKNIKLLLHNCGADFVEFDEVITIPNNGTTNIIESESNKGDTLKRTKSMNFEKTSPTNIIQSDEPESYHDCIRENDVMLADSAKLGQVLRNLMSNAIKFTPHNGTVNVNITFIPNKANKTKNLTSSYDEKWSSVSRHLLNKVSTLSNDNKNFSHDDYDENTVSLCRGKLVIEIKDNGIGISSEKKSRLFQDISQFNPETLHAGGGNGLGLWISKCIVDLHGGRISAHSKGDGEGSTFRIEIPMVRTSSTDSISTKTTVNVTRSNFEIIQSDTLEEYNQPEISTLANLAGSTSSLPSLFHRVVSMSSIHSESGSGLEILDTLQADSSVPSETTSIDHEITVYDVNMAERSHIQNISVAKPPEDKNTNTTPIKIDVTPRKRAVVDISDSNPQSLCDDIVQTTLSSTNIIQKKKFLIVDDVTAIRKMMRKLLEQRGHSCDEAENGLIALNMVNEMHHKDSIDYFDAIFMDFVMPEMNGPEATKAIRESGFNGLIIGVTANCHIEDRTTFKDAGVNDIIIKPLKIEKLMKIIEDV